jgi:hypothetical protein
MGLFRTSSQSEYGWVFQNAWYISHTVVSLSDAVSIATIDKLAHRRTFQCVRSAGNRTTILEMLDSGVDVRPCICTDALDRVGKGTVLHQLGRNRVVAQETTCSGSMGLSKGVRAQVQRQLLPTGLVSGGRVGSIAEVGRMPFDT